RDKRYFGDRVHTIMRSLEEHCGGMRMVTRVHDVYTASMCGSAVDVQISRFNTIAELLENADVSLTSVAFYGSKLLFSDRSVNAIKGGCFAGDDVSTARIIRYWTKGYSVTFRDWLSCDFFHEASYIYNDQIPSEDGVINALSIRCTCDTDESLNGGYCRSQFDNESAIIEQNEQILKEARECDLIFYGTGRNWRNVFTDYSGLQRRLLERAYLDRKKSVDILEEVIRKLYIQSRPYKNEP
ncbi:MAG: hypothetical protein MUO31_07060, partial [Thermodesulfovibrionales bacterium]|nr:hypothetical protein [Thermodesulfovibrionales bacterium]